MLKRILSLFRNLFRKRAVEQELNDELRSSLDVLTQEKMKQGLSQSVARREALIELGGVEQVKEEVRAARAGRILEDFARDVRFGFRTLAKSPGFTTVAILTLALGIGANTAIFSLVDAVILRTLPVRDPGQLVLLKWSARNWPSTHASYFWGGCPGRATRTNPGGCSFSYPLFDQIQRARTGFSGVLAFTGIQRFDTSFHGQVGAGTGQFVSGDFFSVLDERPAAGRLLASSDDVAGAGPALVLSYGYWQSHFGDNLSVVGKNLLVNSVPFTITGIAPNGFIGLDTGIPVDFWIPLSCQPSVFPYFPKKNDAAGLWLFIGGRLKPGIPLSRAQSAVSLIFARTETSSPGAIFKPGDAPSVELPSMSRGLATLRQRFSEPLFVLMAAVGIILLIVCANLASLMLARATNRQKEITVRLAMGAGRWRVTRQLFTESALLAAVGGAVGILLAYWGSSSMASFLSANSYMPLEIDTRPNFQILGFTLAIALLAAILFGFAPLVFGSRVELMPALKEAGGGSPGGAYAGRQRSRFSSALVIAQVALSVLVLAGAGLLVRTLANLETMKVGFDKHNLLIFYVDTTLSGVKGPQLQVLSRNLRDRFASLPGVTSASYSRVSLMSGANMTTMIFLQGAEGEQKASVEELPVGPKFFRTMHIPVLAGRTFASVDFRSEAKPEPVLINQTLAHRYFGNENPLGHRLGEKAKAADWQIVGIVANAKYSSLRAPIAPTVYRPLRTSLGGPAFELRTDRNPNTLISLVRSAAEKVNKGLLLTNVTTQTKQIDKTLYQERLVARLSGAFGLLALVLAGVGLYGLLAYQVARRTHEIGIRMALGAQKSDVLKMVLTQGFKLTLVGVAFGIAGALAMTRFLASLLYGVKPTDSLTFIVVSLILTGAALLACYIPARRATKVDPIVALRHE